MEFTLPVAGQLIPLGVGQTNASVNFNVQCEQQAERYDIVEGQMKANVVDSVVDLVPA